MHSSSRPAVVAAWCCVAAGTLAGNVFGQPSLAPPIQLTNGWFRVQGTALTNQVLTLEASSNLVRWSPIALLDGRSRDPITSELAATNTSFQFLDPGAARFKTRFYRSIASPITSTHDWKNQALYPNDAFASLPGSEGAGPGICWIKFAILLNDPDRVFYQDSDRYLLHHDFASARLAPFLGMSRAAFDQVSLFTANQQVLLGTVLFAPEDHAGEYAIQFAGRDPYPGEMVRRFFELVRSTVVAEGAVPFYFPAYEQSQAAALDQDFFARHGIRVSSVNRWIRGDQVYAAGWALGHVQFIPSAQIEAAYGEGRLRPEDILLTDGVPAEVPFVAGIVSFTPATPNSHVAILAGAYGVPFAYLADPAAQAKALQLVGQEAVLQATMKDDFAQVQFLNVADTLDPSLRAELLALQTPPQPQIKPKARFGAFSASTDTLTPDDIRFFGGKAAHFGLLRRVVPSNSPPAIALSFDLWDAFMDQAMPSGKSLRAQIAERLSRHSYPPDMGQLSADLAVIREWITKVAVFTPDQKAQIVSALGVFDPAKNIRFRSSSNAEDTETFTAAGLYDSYSGCLADDLDADTAGPCRCDPVEDKERGVFRAIQKVYASFYNDNAFRERLRRGLDETQLAMGVLVHHSVPDEFELANGVATLHTQADLFGGRQVLGKLVTQLGAVSVTNPEGNAKPETMDLTEWGATLTQPSGLVPLGSHVMDWPADYDTLRELLFAVYRQYRGPAGQPTPSPGPILDFEYKKVVPGKIVLKQVRALPPPSTTTTATYLLNEPTTYWVYQSESSDVFANHRLKCWLTLENRSLRLDPTHLNECLYPQSQFEFRTGTNLHTLAGPMTNWPNFKHSLTNDPRRGTVLSDSWTVGTGADQRRFELISVLPSASGGLFLRQAEIRKWLRVTYAQPVPTLDFTGSQASTTEEEVQLIASADPATFRAGAVETFASTSGLEFEVSFLTSTNAAGPPLGIDKNFWGTYPAALSSWMHTRISGLTTQPLELTGYWSQSARAGHKYRYAWYLFEPELDPGVTATQIQELRAANIQWIHIERETWPGGKATIHTLGPDGSVRKLAGWSEEKERRQPGS